MNSTSSNLKHITGDLAYLIYWLTVYKCEVSLSSVEAIDRNLEIIVNSEGDLLAYRYAHPIEMIGLVSGDGKWHLINKEYLSKDEVLDLKRIFDSLRSA